MKEKLSAAADMRKSINEKREQYRPAATRGSLLYFSIVDMSLVNHMYQTSLDQFQTLFDKSMDVAEKAALASKRVSNITDAMTYTVYRYISRGLYERDKVSFKLIVTFKILVTAGKIDARGISIFLRAGSALDSSQMPKKPYHWMSANGWLNILQLSTSGITAFRSILEDLERNELMFAPWCNENDPETVPVPIIEFRNTLNDEEVFNNFNRCVSLQF